MSAPNWALAAISEQDDATRTAFAAMDLALAKALGFYWAPRQGISESLEDFAHREDDSGFSAINGLRNARTRIAADVLTALLRNPNAKGTVSEMAEWSVLGADILLDKLATQRARRMAPAGTPPT